MKSRVKIVLSYVFRERAAVRYQFMIDILDVWIPAANLGLVEFNDGILGVFG